MVKKEISKPLLLLYFFFGICAMIFSALCVCWAEQAWHNDEPFELLLFAGFAIFNARNACANLEPVFFKDARSQ